MNKIKKSRNNSVYLLIMITLIILLLCSCELKEKSDFQDISPKEAHARIQNEKGIIILDVRTAEEFAQKHIIGSILIPVTQLENEVEEIIQSKDSVIFIYCRSGNRSITAAKILVKLGYTNVYNLGGIKDWPYETEIGHKG